MAWWWSSSSSDGDQSMESPVKPPQVEKSSFNTELPHDSFPTPSNDFPATVPEPAQPLSRDELAYEELKDMFARLDSEGSKRAASAAKAVVAEKSDRATVATNSALYPSTMSCRQAWDQAFYCQSVGGQMNNIYRYGGLRSCSEVWAQWRFCMRMKTVRNEDERASRIQQWYKERAVRYKTGPSSEDIWEVRRSPGDMEVEEHEPESKNDGEGFHYT